jgi:hypothetical protein
MKNPDKVIKEAVKDANHTLAEYLYPGERNCNQTVQKLLTTLDNNDVAEAILESDAREANKDGGRSKEPGAARPLPHQHH